jgi:DNA-binding NarL/FixJ family response regulator
MSIRLLIADDHPVFRFGLKSLIEGEPEFEIIGEASSGEEAISLARSLEPDVILMDITMPGINGIQATERILETHPDIGILIVTMVDDASLFPALRAGARGYLLKGAEGVETLRAIRAVASGEMIFSRSIGERLGDYFQGTTPLAPEVFPDLTPREHEVLELVAEGLTNSAIAERLSLSPKTVRNQVSTVFSKLGVNDRSEAIVKAREAGLGR